MNIFTEIYMGWYEKVFMGSSYIMVLWLLFILKHLVVDFFWQKPYQYLNKGTYGHPGGIVHAGLHGITTFLILIAVCASSWPTLLFLAFFDMATHYHIDWAKVQINKKKDWGPTTHEQFWWLLGADQTAHFLVYWLIIGSAL